VTDARRRASSAAIRRRVLAEWRGYHEPPNPERNLHLAGDLAREVIASLAGADYLAEDEVRTGWAAAVGPFLAANSQPVSLKRGVLRVRIVQPSVRYALEQGMKGELLAKLQTTFGADRIRDLSFTTT